MVSPETAADVYFSGLGSAQMARMNIADESVGGFGGSPISGNPMMQNMYVVTQNQPQQMSSPANGDLLLL